MKSKIIFWANDALAFIGLPKNLQEKHNFDIYAILDDVKNVKDIKRHLNNHGIDLNG